MANMLRAVQPQRDPCEKDLKALCTDTPHKLHCLGKNAKKISTECADEVKGTVSCFEMMWWIGIRLNRT